MGTDNDWEKWGYHNPYYGVLSADQFRHDNLTEQSRSDFFRSGEIHVQMIFDTIRLAFDTDLSPEMTLDFGCGVGRLVIPFALKSKHVVGIDISPSMLAEAKRNCSRYENCSFVLSDDNLSKVDGKFDLVHSYIVLQHISQKRGLHIIEELLKRVCPGGFAVIHFIYRCNAPTILRGLVRLRYALPPVNYARNLYRRQPVFDPPMQLHVYDLPKILHSMNRLGFTHIHQILDSMDNDQFDSTIMFAHRNVTA